MPALLQKIRKRRWDRPTDWAGEDDAPSDVLGDLSTSGGVMSVWLVDDDETNLLRIVTALAASGESPANIDYALIDPTGLSGLGIDILKNPGVSPDEDANSRWHCDLVVGSASKLHSLSVWAFWHCKKKGRVGEKEILTRLLNSLSDKTIKRDRLSKPMRTKLDAASQASQRQSDRGNN